MRMPAKELGHLKPATSIRIKNATTDKCAHDDQQQKKSKSFDVRLQWLRYRMNNSQFEIFWIKGDFNCAYYHSKHHSSAHSKQVHPKHLVAKAAIHHREETRFT